MAMAINQAETNEDAASRVGQRLPLNEYTVEGLRSQYHLPVSYVRGHQLDCTLYHRLPDTPITSPAGPTATAVKAATVSVELCASLYKSMQTLWRFCFYFDCLIFK